MERSERHAFRFFVDVVGAPSARVQLDEFDAHHARVLHGAQMDARVEVVDSEGSVWHAQFEGVSGELELLDRIRSVAAEPRIDLFALVTVGGRTDELVDGAVQAGATRIVPVVLARRDAEKVDARMGRLMRIAASAAKQAKRAVVPTVTAAIGVDDLCKIEPGIVIAPDADETLVSMLATHASPAATRLLVGSARGFPQGLLESLDEHGWARARLGSPILRSELAAAVAVAITSMSAPRSE